MLTNPDLSERPLARLLEGVYDRLSRELAGGQRTDPNDLVPWAADLGEGVVPEQFVPEVDYTDWFDPTVWAGATPEALDAGRIDLSAIPAATGPGRDGDGMDWFRSGEAPNNYANRHNPLYVARRQFAVAIAHQIEDLFDVSTGGSAGYMRPPQASDAEPGGRSPNSDHYSGGALDITGDPEKLTALRNWLIEQPWVSFVRWQSESHYDHLHVSIDLGWIAQNFFANREVPALRAPGTRPTPPPPSVTRSAPTVGDAGGGRVAV